MLGKQKRIILFVKVTNDSDRKYKKKNSKKENYLYFYHPGITMENILWEKVCAFVYH